MYPIQIGYLTAFFTYWMFRLEFEFDSYDILVDLGKHDAFVTGFGTFYLLYKFPIIQTQM